MGFFSDLLNGGRPDDDGEDSKSASARNSAEEQARDDYIAESLRTGGDPIPDETPDWAKNLPNPSDQEDR